MTRELTLRPIGFIRTGKAAKFDARHQPEESVEETNTLELSPDSGYEQALADVAGFSRVWLIWWFHRNDSWKPMVRPPRGDGTKRGVFATRSPHRPNPLGMTPVRLVGVKGRRLLFGACDLVDGTPVFDIKPYIPAYDAFAGERTGWMEEVDAKHAAAPEFTVSLSPVAEAQAAWLASEYATDFRPKLTGLLSRDPSPHRTRRIRKRADGSFEIGCGSWRAFFTVTEKAVVITALGAGYAPAFLNDPARPHVPERDAQLAFHARWPRTDDGAKRLPSRPARKTHWKDAGRE